MTAPNVQDIPAAIAEEFGLVGELRSDSNLSLDLGLDSLDMLDLVLFLEELANVRSASVDVDFPVLLTVADAQAHFELLVKESSNGRPTNRPTWTGVAG